MMIVMLASNPGVASAHATLESSIPEANTQMDASPAAIVLNFNEAIEAKLGSVEVLDSKSNPVTNNKPVVSNGSQTLKLDLPKLKEGLYTVSYQIISVDGHPVSGSYIFVVGNPPEGIDASAFNPHKELGHEGHTVSTQLTTNQFIIYAVRTVYYASLLFSAGIMFWSLLSRGRIDALAAVLRKYELLAMRSLMISALLYVFVHAREIMSGYAGNEYGRLFFSTSVGRDWIVLLVLAILGFLAIRMGKAVKAVWAVIILGLESWSGHAVVYKPEAATVSLDFIHLAASSIWVGGFVLLLALWISDRKEAGRFAVQFSRAALISLAALVISGVAMTLLFLPSLNYLFYTAWGTLLLVKTGLVLLVFVFGGLLHLRVRRGDMPTLSLLRVDGLLMALIIIVAALFTYISPLPVNEPVAYHKMGEDMHLSLRITPNKPGVNKFVVKVWLPDKVGAPKSVILRLRSDDRKELGPIDIPLKTFEDTEITTFDGYVKEAYTAEGPYVPFAGRWTAEIRVMTKNDDEKVERYPFRNY
ncbi:copper transporter [Paenibacillus baekrokdamisoli]|uniref:Copper transporter n=1 Tax=Paenibacillus baekrokdamisoli TaxID=1712516 RepID=A0A3G9JG87_9BACL|nr:copper resistance protein CopC [Paenibacillus baekrokdamisoli]BBH24911.1 copper transporter [Paenibacillus baekrokdamisoli]